MFWQTVNNCCGLAQLWKDDSSAVLRLIINSKQPNLAWLTQESLRMVTARVLVVLSGSFTSQIETGPTVT